MDCQLKKMDSQQLELYKRLQEFSFDRPDTQLSFSRRLARDNNWSQDYTERVIAEYKKFAFLAVVAGHPVTPSDQVDQVWHLHLTYTRSYWQEFCPKVLQTPLHHDPTRGGAGEQSKFKGMYHQTLVSYEQFFGQVPTDIWSSSNDRFGKDLNFVRVNTQKNWVFLKPSLPSLPRLQYKQALIPCFLLTLASVVTGCQLSAGIPNPLDFSGSEFLTFYFLLSTVVIAAAYGLRCYLRSPGEARDQKNLALDVYETAYLAEGKNRVIDTAILHLVQKKYVVVELGKLTLTLRARIEDLSHPLEQAVIKAIRSDKHINQLRAAVTGEIQVIRDRLRDLGLLLSQKQALKVQIYPVILIASLVGLGIAKISVGVSRGKPVGFLIAMCFVIAVVGLGFWLILSRRSRFGDRFLTSLHREHIRLIATDQEDPTLPLVFALLGSLAITNLSPELKNALFIGSNSDGSSWSSDSSNSGSSDSGGGDSGGGGCGGCGGD